MWTAQDFRLADLLDAININSWVVGNAPLESSKRQPLPPLAPRPAQLRQDTEKQARIEVNARRFQQAWRKRNPKEKPNGD